MADIYIFKGEVERLGKVPNYEIAAHRFLMSFVVDDMITLLH